MMQKVIRHIIPTILAATMLCVYSSCSDSLDENVSVSNQSVSAYVSLTFAAPSSDVTRSNPTGGEEGDGEREHGQDYENTITDAVAFLYQDDLGINGDASASVTAVYFDEIWISSSASTDRIDRTYITKAEEVNIPLGTYQVLVVTNPGDDWWSSNTNLTLGDVRDHIQQTAWEESNGSYSYFAMSSEKDADITIDENSIFTNPARTEVDVERVAARIDYQESGTYTCDDPNYDGATVELTGACIVNNLTAGSYLMKRVATTVGGDVTYLGDETCVEDATAADYGAGTNYVIDPWTADKTTANISSGFTINGVSNMGAIDLYGTWWGDDNASNPNWWTEKAGTPTEVTDDNGDTWLRIGYTMENTTSAESSSWQYNTAVIFKAKFTPVGVSNYTTGSTFFAFGEHLFASMEDLMEFLYKDGVSGLETQIDNCTTWADVITFYNGLLTNDPSGYYDFLKTQATGKTETDALTDTEKAALKWTAYMLSECGYSAAFANDVYTVTLDQEGKQTAEILGGYGTRTYVNAECYYTWWVRHANDNDDATNGIMEFATVRNCIYKLTVKSIYSLGGYIPGDESVILDVYVKDWTLLGEEVLEM